MLVKAEKNKTAPTCNTGGSSVVISTVGWLLALLPCLVNTGYAEPPAARPLRVLFVGNSYTRYHNLSQVLAVMAASARPAFPLETVQSAFDSYTLERHWEEGKTTRAIRDGHWDIVVLQGHSLQPVRNPKRMHTSARKLDAEIKQRGARTVFFMTWAHQDKPEMLAGVVQTYNTIAAELGATVAPVGLAWQRALQERPCADAVHTRPLTSLAQRHLPHGLCLLCYPDRQKSTRVIHWGLAASDSRGYSLPPTDCLGDGHPLPENGDTAAPNCAR